MANRLMTVAFPVRSRLAAAGLACAVLLAGCGDPAFEKQAAFEKSFDEVAAKYASILGTNPDLTTSAPSDESFAALTALATQARGLSTSSSAQAQAAQTLASSIHRTAGLVAMSKASTIEAQHAAARDMVRAATMLASELDAIAQSDADALREGRDFARAAAEQSGAAARQVEGVISALEAPARAQAQKIAAGTARLNELAQETAVLVRKARESSPAAGLAFVEEASKIRAEARTVQLEVATTETASIATSTDLAVSNAVLAGAKQVQAAASGALEMLESYEKGVAAEAGRAKAFAQELRAGAETMLNNIAEQRAGALKAAYEAAAEHFAQAQQGGAGGGEAQALANAITADELRIARAQVDAAGAQARLLDGMQSQSAASGDAKAAVEAAIATFKEKATAAADAVASFGDDPATAGFKKFVDEAKKQADGATYETVVNPPKPAEKKPARAASSGRSSSGSGATEAELDALLARINAADSDGDDLAAAAIMLEVMDDTTSAGKAMKDFLSNTMGAMTPLTEAIEEKFGKAEAKAFFDKLQARGQGSGAMGGMGGSAKLGKLTKKSVDGDRAVCIDENGQEIVFVNRSGAWRADMTAGAAAEQAEQLEQLMPMMSMMLAPMKKGMEAVAARIRSGEITSVDQIDAAMQQEMQKAMGGALGGGGGPGRGRRGQSEGDN